MKKIIFSFAIAAMMASCIQKGLNEEGQQAWEKFKELSATFESTTTAYDTYETQEDFNAACAAWSKAVEDMAPYVIDLYPEQLDSNVTVENVGAVVKQIQEEVNAPAEPAEEEEAVEEEEVEE